MTVKTTLTELAQAWANRDVDRVVACFAEDAEYFSSVGPLPGTKACGIKSIRLLITRMFELDDACSSVVTDVHVSGNYASWRWCYTHADRTHEFGCDLFVFRGDLILLKDAYRKQNGPEWTVLGEC